MEETASALAHAVQSGRRCMSGSPLTRQSGRKKWSSTARVENSAVNSSTFVQFTEPWVDKSGLLDTLQNNGVGCIALLLWLRDC